MLILLNHKCIQWWFNALFKCFETSFQMSDCPLSGASVLVACELCNALAKARELLVLACTWCTVPWWSWCCCLETEYQTRPLFAPLRKVIKNIALANSKNANGALVCTNWRNVSSRNLRNTIVFNDDHNCIQWWLCSTALTFNEDFAQHNCIQW